MTATHRNNVNVLGDSPRTLMFAHGYGCDQSMWRRVAPSFQKDYKLVLFDYVGAGGSDSSAFDRTHYSTLRGYAQDVLEIIEELNLKEVTFIGHSVSSMIGALAAIEKPAYFQNLVMIGPSPSYINDGEYVGGFERADIDGLLSLLDSNHLGWSATMAPLIMGKSNSPEIIGELQESFCRTDPMFAQHFARVTFLSDNRKDLHKLQTRTLILQCDQDIIAPPQVGRFVHQCIRNSQLEMMQATGHCPHMSAPPEVVAHIRRFLQ